MQGHRLLNLAEDIVRHGLDPTTLVSVVPTGDQRKRYRVVEGNHRVLALKALETPSIISHTLNPADQRRLARLSARYLDNPYDAIPCVLFDKEVASLHWVELRHTGLNEGVGLHEWGANERDRFRERHRGVRKPAGQILDFVEAYGSLSDEAKGSKVGILTNIERLLISRSARNALGIDIVDGQVVSYFPRHEVAKGLTHVVEDLKTKRANVKDVYHAQDRDNYVAQLPKRSLPTSDHRLTTPVRLSDLAKGKSTPAPDPPQRRRRPLARRERTSVIPSDCVLNIPAPRINKIYNELTQLNVETFPNAGAVLLRVFLELSTDHGLARHNVMSEKDRQNRPLAARLKALANYFKNSNVITDELRRAVYAIADRNRGPIDASTMVLNQYVHNAHVHPTSAELRAAWDQLQPFLEKVWP